MEPIALIRLLDVCRANLWQACWQGGLVVLAVGLMVWLLPAIPARCQAWLWRLATLKFAVVLLLPTLVDLPLLPAPAARPAKYLPADPQAIAFVLAGTTEHVAVSPARVVELPSLQTVLCWGWIIGVVWSLARLSVAWRNARQLRRRGRIIAQGPIVEQLQIQAKLFGLRRVPKLLAVDGDGSPMLLGVFRPAIAIPRDTLAQLSGAEQALVLGHELAHVRRGDLRWGLLAAILRCVFFFHPLVWLSQRQLQLAQELAADELAIARQRHDPLGYGNLLVSVLGKLGSPSVARPLISTLTLETAGPLHSLTRRLVAMARIGPTSRRIVITSGLLLASLVLLGLVPWRLVAAEAKKGEQTVLQGSLGAIATALDAAASAPLNGGRAQYLAKLVITEIKKDGSKRICSTPAIMGFAGCEAELSSVYGAELLNLKIRFATPANQAATEHVVDAKLVHHRKCDVEIASAPARPALSSSPLPECYRDPDEGNRALKAKSPQELDTMRRRNQAWLDADERNRCVLARSRTVVRDAAPFDLSIPRADGVVLRIEGTISPVEGLAKTAAWDSALPVAAPVAPARAVAPASGALEAAKPLRLSELDEAQASHNQAIGSGKQVLVHLKIAEVSLSKLRHMSFDQPGAFGSPSGLLSVGPSRGDTLSLALLDSDKGVLQVLEALGKDKLAKVVSTPTLAVLSGATGVVQFGGQLPVPKRQPDGWMAIDFGTRLEATPKVLGNKKVRLEIRARLAELDYGHAVRVGNQEVPGVLARELSTCVELTSGQTLVIRGPTERHAKTRHQGAPNVSELPKADATVTGAKESDNETGTLILVRPEIAQSPATAATASRGSAPHAAQRQ